MAEARGRDAWGRTATVLALLANIHRDPKKHRAFRPSDFNPYETKRGSGIPIKAKDIGLLKKVFVGPERVQTSEKHGR